MARKRVGVPGTIYMAHFDKPYGHARHYIGWAEDAEKRFKRHKAGGGSRLLRAVGKIGTKYRVVRTWPGTRFEERKLKRQKNSWRFCPICMEVPRSGLAEHMEQHLKEIGGAKLPKIRKKGKRLRVIGVALPRKYWGKQLKKG